MTSSNSLKLPQNSISKSITLSIGEIKRVDNDYTLLLDFDWEYPIIPNTIEELFDRLILCGTPARNIEVERSCSGHGFHYIITLHNPLPLISRIALQAICGSDPKREAINFLRASHLHTDCEYANILFSRKEKVTIPMKDKMIPNAEDM